MIKPQRACHIVIVSETAYALAACNLSDDKATTVVAVAGAILGVFTSLANWRTAQARGSEASDVVAVALITGLLFLIAIREEVGIWMLAPIRAAIFMALAMAWGKTMQGETD